jgi:ankyrin repeat protein
LWVAAQNGHAEIAELLVEAGADPSLGPGDSNAAEVAEAFGHEQLFAYLQNVA